MSSQPSHGRAYRTFWKITEFPRVIIALCAGAALLFGAFLPQIHKDSRVEAFIPPQDPALAFREEVKRVFGMADPMVILVVNDSPEGIFTSHTVDLVEKLTSAVRGVPGIDPDGVTSLATMKAVESGPEGIVSLEILDPRRELRERAATARAVVGRHRSVTGTIVADDFKSTLIVVERFDDSDGIRIYRALRGVADSADVSGGEKLYVAGHGAMSATLGEYIDSDTRLLYGIVTVVIAAVLAATFRTVYGVVLPLILIGATLAIGMGAMGVTGAPFTVIASALPVVLSSLVVTDGLHILSLYYGRLARDPDAPKREHVVGAMAEIWRPCVGARVTDIAGFAGLYLGSAMPPMKAFGLYGSIGIGAEMVLSLVGYPCLLLLASPPPSPVFAAGKTSASVIAVRRFLDRTAAVVLERSRVVLFGSFLILVAGVTGIVKLVINDSWIGNFDDSSPVRVAAEELSRRHGILNDLDLMIDTGKPEGMLEPSVLSRIERLESELVKLPFLSGASSITGLLGEIGRSTGNATGASALPDSRELAAQYLMIADPDATRRWIDEDQRRGLLRAHLTARDYLEEQQFLRQLRSLIRKEFPDSSPAVSAGGMVVVSEAWVDSVGSFHVLSTALSVGFCWLQMSAGFGSLALGSLAIVPMAAAMLLMYAAMGWGGIPLGIATSMFAALAIGTGVDFAIHTVDRFLVLREERPITLAEAMAEIMPTTGRTVLYSAVAIILGFAVLCFSAIPAVRSLGVLVTVSVTASLFATLTLLPVLIKILRPRRLPGGMD